MQKTIWLIVGIVLSFSLCSDVFGKSIGSNRRFEDKKYPGTWIITNIIKDKRIEIDMILKSDRCSNCGYFEEKKKVYVFTYIEELKQGVTTIHYATSPSKRCVILENYLTSAEIKNRLKE